MLGKEKRKVIDGRNQEFILLNPIQTIENDRFATGGVWKSLFFLFHKKSTNRVLKMDFGRREYEEFHR
jgi:hypothetical protein